MDAKSGGEIFDGYPVFTPTIGADGTAVGTDLAGCLLAAGPRSRIQDQAGAYTTLIFFEYPLHESLNFDLPLFLYEFFRNLLRIRFGKVIKRS